MNYLLVIKNSKILIPQINLPQITSFFIKKTIAFNSFYCYDKGELNYNEYIVIYLY